MINNYRKNTKKMGSYGTITPERDASLGLIFRMNNLWARIDTLAENGRYDEWSNVLDRIFANLDYKDDYEPIRNTDGKIIGVNMDSQEKEIFDFLSERVIAAKKKAINSKSKNELARARGEWYEALLKKDRWLRKFMQKLKLYLKEVEHSPGTAMFGSFGSRGTKR